MKRLIITSLAVSGILAAMLVVEVTGSGESPDARAAGTNSIVTVDEGSGGLVGVDSSIELDGSGNPVISYRDNIENDLTVIH
jgi:hypothetical protein